MIKKYRVLSAINFNEKQHKANDVIEVDDGDVKHLIEYNLLDDSASAIKYCVEELKSIVIKYEKQKK
jgi:hypothetical protein